MPGVRLASMTGVMGGLRSQLRAICVYAPVSVICEVDYGDHYPSSSKRLSCVSAVF